MRILLCSFLLAIGLLGSRMPGTAEENDAGKLYAARCVLCHGVDGQPRGIAKGAATFTDEAWKKATSIEQVEKTIAEGRARMPGFSAKLTAEQIKILAAYVLAMK